METRIHDRPAFANVRANLSSQDSIVAESDAMASMSKDIRIKPRWNGSFIQAILRKLFGGESLFINEFTTPTSGSLVLTQPMPGDIEEVSLHETTLYLQPGAFLCCESSVQLGMGWAGIASLVGGEGLFRLKVSGTGRIWFGAYGGIYAQEVAEELVVDTGHLVAYEPSIGLRMGLAGGIFSSFFSGEGLVTRVRGPGRVYLQSRSLKGLASWANGHIY